MRKLILALIITLALQAVCFAANALYRPDKSGDEILQALIAEKASKFTTHTFSDDVTGLTISYSLYLPEGAERKSPAVFFIADGSSAGKPPRFSLTQGYGALVWPDDCVVIVPSYPELILDDRDGYVVSSYVGLTERFVRWAVKAYSVDPERVYVTGQSMGCMTWLLLAAQNPELFTASMFVSGQWNVEALQGLKDQKFVYIASAGDDKASAGQQEVIDYFAENGIPFVFRDEIDARNQDYVLPKSRNAHYFLKFRAGSTLPEEETGQYSEHMTSFDYAYRMHEVREWLLEQRKGD